MPGRDPVERQTGADDPGREVQDVGLVDADRGGDQPADLGLVGLAGRTGRGVGAAARRDDGRGPAEPAARIAGRGREVGARPPDGRGRERVRREDGGHGGRTRRRDGDGEVRPARGLDPGCQSTGPESGREAGSSLDAWEGRRGRREVGPSMVAVIEGQGSSGSCSRPAVSGRPWTRLNDWIGLAGGALDEVVLGGEHDDPAGPLVEADVDQHVVGAGRVLGRRRRGDDAHERLVAVGGGIQLVELGLASPARVGRTWLLERMPRAIGMRWGRKSTARCAGVGVRVEALAVGRDAQLLLDLGDVAVAADAVGRDALVDLAEHQVRLGLAAGAADAALGVDDEVADEPGPGQGGQREERRGGIAAGRADDRDGRFVERR